MYVYIERDIDIDICIHTYVYVFRCIHTYTHTSIYIYIYIYMHIYRDVLLPHDRDAVFSCGGTADNAYNAEVVTVQVVIAKSEQHTHKTHLR